MFIIHGGEVKVLCQPKNLRVLCHDDDSVEQLCWNDFQRSQNQTAALKLGGQFVFTKTPRISGSHDDAA